MNRINFNGKNGGIFHHLTPYRKKVTIKQARSESVKETVTKVVPPEERYPWEIRVPNVAPIVNIISNTPVKELRASRVTVIDNPQNYKHKNGFKNYHKHQSFEIGSQSLSVTDSIGGCGMQQFYGWTGILKEDVAYELIEYYIQNRHNGVGLIICQLGQDYFNHHFERALIRHNFKVISEYKNFMHGNDGKYKQRVYGLQLELNSIVRSERNN